MRRRPDYFVKKSVACGNIRPESSNQMRCRPDFWTEPWWVVCPVDIAHNPFFLNHSSPPPPNQIYSRNWYIFSVLKLTKFPPPFGEDFTFYYTHHVMKRFILHVHRTRPLNGFENGSNLAETRIEYVLLTSWDGNSIFFLSEAGAARFAKWVYGMEFP